MGRNMKDSGIEWIGEIPEGWEITKIKHIVSSVTDIDHFMPDSAEFGIPYLMIGDLKDLSSSIDWDSSKKISIEDYKKLSIKSRPQIGDIIFARYASIGTTCYIDTDRDFLVSYACLTIHPSDLIILLSKIILVCGRCSKKDQFQHTRKCRKRFSDKCHHCSPLNY